MAARALALALLGGAMLAPLPGLAAGPTGDQQISDDDSAAQPEAPARIDGFRGALFGMDEAAVRTVLATEFDVAEGAIARAINGIEQTVVLRAELAELVPDGGPVNATFVFGHSSHGLIEVTLVWSSETSTTDGLNATATILRDFLAAQPYAPENIARDLALPGGTVVLFTASDADGRRIALSVRETPFAPSSEAAEGAAEAQPRILLRLSYVADPQNPDVFRAPVPLAGAITRDRHACGLAGASVAPTIGLAARKKGQRPSALPFLVAPLLAHRRRLLACSPAMRGLHLSRPMLTWRS